MVIGDRLIQATNLGGLRLVGNRIEENHITLPRVKDREVTDPLNSSKNLGGVVVTSPSVGTLIRHNVIDGHGARPAIRLNGFAGAATTAVNYPRRCSGDASRFCTSNEDCEIVPAAGTCPAFVGHCLDPTFTGDTGPDCQVAADCATGRVCASAIVDGRAQQGKADGNELIGPFGAGTTSATDSAITVGNHFGAQVIGNDVKLRETELSTPFGIVLTTQGMADATITANIIDGAQVAGINLRAANVSSFGAKISRNDIIHCTKGVTATGAYPASLSTELSVAGVGNFWGHEKAPGFSSDLAQIHDVHPFCQPVARLAPDAVLPPTCP
jgi:hypothetical protein